MQDATARSEFEAFAREHWATLMSIGVAVSGSRQEAEDLVQTALTATYAKWRRVRRENALAYVRRSILNANVSRWRRRSSSEVVLADLPETPDPDDAARGVDDRSSLLPALRALPAGQRAVLVLRYLCDESDADIAATLGISPAGVRSQASRGLATLRAHSTDEVICHD